MCQPALQFCLFFISLLFLSPVIAQDFASIPGKAGGDNEILSLAYHQKRLPAGYSGYAIEIAASELPMKADSPVFQKFGNVYYHKLAEGGYSYVIQTQFSDYSSTYRFFENVIQPRIPDARIVEYRKGKRSFPD